MPGVLEGIRVLDFGRYIAGPFCGTMLGDLGAEVIRIEKLEGSEDRWVTPVVEGGEGAMFLQMGRNKLGLTLNPMKPAGREIVQKLVAVSDVVIANLPYEDMKKMGIDYDTLSAINPRIILATASAFGSAGPLAKNVGFDAVGQAMSGAVYLGGSDGAPARAQVNYVDFTTALHCAFGVMLALRERERTGRGQRVSGSLLGSALAISNGLTIDHALNGIDRGMMGSRAFSSAPTDIFATRDGWVMTQVVGNPIFARWARLIGRPELAEDPRFASDIARGEHGAELSVLMAEWCAERTTEIAISELGEARVPAGPVLRPSEALAEPQVAATRLVEQMAYPGAKGTAPIVRTPITLSGNAKAALVPAPRAGEHGEDILAELGYDPDAISALRRDRII